MATYRYYSTDILTGAVLAELPLNNVSMTRMLSAAGTLNAKMKIGSKIYNDVDLLAGTETERTAIYCTRDGTLIWGGPVWQRGYDSSSKEMMITANTWESYFDHVVIESDFVQQNLDQLLIFKNLITALQAQAGSNVGFITSGMSTVSGVNRTILTPGYEFHFAQEVVSQLIGVEDGFDYMIDLQSAGNDLVSKIVKVGYPTIGQTNEGLVLAYDYPGSVLSYTWPENPGGTKFAVLGNGTGSAQLRAVAVAADLLAAGYPSWWVTKSFGNLTTQAQVTAKANAIKGLTQNPIVTPTFTLKSDRVPQFDNWNALGTNIQVYIDDERFPNGKLVTSRMVGWNLQPTGSDGSEKLDLVIAGDN